MYVWLLLALLSPCSRNFEMEGFGLHVLECILKYRYSCLYLDNGHIYTDAELQPATAAQGDCDLGILY